MRAGWTPTISPRRSHEQSQESSPEASTISSSPRRRSSSDDISALLTPRQTPAGIRFLSSSMASSGQETTRGAVVGDPPSSSKRLGFFADKLSSSLAGASSGNQKTLSPLYSHSNSGHMRADSALSTASTLTTTAPQASMSNATAKAHASPSKPSYGRTYDSKLVSREMHRLAHPLAAAGLAPALSQAPSASSLTLPAQGTMAPVNMTSTSGHDPWGALHVHVLPLFNGEPLRIPIEDLNVLVKRHVSSVVSSAPSKAIATLEHDAAELIASGMVTLNAKLMGLDDDKLVARVVEIWGFFWDQVLPYVEGVLLPLQTDPLLSSIYRAPKRPSSPTSRQNSKGSISSFNTLQLSSYHIDVRTVALRSFRDRVILPLSSRLYARLSASNRQDNFQETSYQQPRLQQMLLVLTSQGRQRAPTSLTSPPPQPTSGETAVSDLLRIVRSPRQQGSRIPTLKMPAASNRAPSFLSGGRPRDRRGRIGIGHKSGGNGPSVGLDDLDLSGDETPRHGGFIDIERERERVMLEALRSPDIDSTQRASAGGWGLGAGHEDSGKMDDEDEPLDWDQAQAVVERMVGMTSQPPEVPRRRAT